MKKKLVKCLLVLFLAASTYAFADTVWQPIEGPANWNDPANWNNGLPDPSGANNDGNARFELGRAECQITDAQVCDQLQLGLNGPETGDPAVLHLLSGGSLSTKNGWSGMVNRPGTIILERGSYIDFIDHFWFGMDASSSGSKVILNGGSINVANASRVGTVNNDTLEPSAQVELIVNEGTYEARYYDNNASGFIADGSSVDIKYGQVIVGQSGDRTADMTTYRDAGRLTAFGGYGEIVIDYNGVIANKTVVTAIDPLAAAPALNSTQFPGDVTLEWDNFLDPNHVGDNVYADVWFGTTSTDPNFVYELNKVVDHMNVTDIESSSTIVSVQDEGQYFWKVELSNVNDTYVGYVMDFNVVTYTEPKLAVESYVTTVDLLPEVISAAVTDNSDPITTVEFAMIEDDTQFPVGASYILDDITTDNQNPTATLMTDMEGDYKISLTISDGKTTIEKLFVVEVYADACEAKKASFGGWNANHYDRDGNCLVDIADFAVMAAEWLNDTSMMISESGDRTVTIIPATVFNARVEGESVDENAVSDAPLTDTTGIRIVDEGGATGGGQALGWAGGGAYAEFAINVPNAGTYDVWLSTAAPNNNCTFNFGDGTTADLYGSAGPFIGTGWGNYNISIHEGAVTFPAAGDYTLRVTWTSDANLDWFSLVAQ